MSSHVSPPFRTTACPRCGRPIPANAVLGACPQCLLAAGFASEPAAPADAAPPPTVAALTPEFPQLELLELLGRGGMGAVYKARQRSLDRLVALKLLRPGLDADPSFAERFTREARALAQLNHPGIVTLYEFGRTPGGLYFILMEFVDGLNLRQLLAAGRLAPREALAIIPPLCDALQYAHDRGIVHRDIKPENILIDRLGRVKIADFGLAKLAATSTQPTSSTPASSTDAKTPSSSDIGHWSLVTDQSGLTEAGKVMGTPRYMAPEQRTQPDAVDHRTDIYALGVVLYQLLTGELPDTGQLQPPSHRVQIDVRLDEIVLRALSTNPSLRYAAANDFKTELEHVTRTSPGTNEPTLKNSATESTPAPAFPRETPSLTRHRPWYQSKRLRITVGVVLVLLLVRTFVLTPYRLESDSLEAVIPRGSWLFIYRLQRTFSPGDIVAYRHESDRTYVGRVTSAGPIDGELLITRNNQVPTAIPTSSIVGKVVLNTRSERVAANPTSRSEALSVDPGGIAPPLAASHTEPADLRAARLDLAEAQLRYLDSHPKVQTLRRRVEALARFPRAEPSLPQDLRDAKIALAEAERLYTKTHPRFQEAESRVRTLEQSFKEALSTMPAQLVITVSVFGAVEQVNTYQLRSGSTLLDALGAAGGWTSNADLSNVTILHRDKSANKQTPTRHRVTAILAGKAPNPALADGDVIHVSVPLF